MSSTAHISAVSDASSDVLVEPVGARRDEAGRDDRGRRGVGADDQMPRRAEQGEQQDRKRRVQARDHGVPAIFV